MAGTKTGVHSKNYRNDGLTIWVHKEQGRKQIGVDVFQLDVNGQIPKFLPGAEDSDIKVSPSDATVNQHF